MLIHDPVLVAIVHMSNIKNTETVHVHAAVSVSSSCNLPPALLFISDTIFETDSGSLSVDVMVLILLCNVDVDWFMNTFDVCLYHRYFYLC